MKRIFKTVLLIYFLSGFTGKLESSGKEIYALKCGNFISDSAEKYIIDGINEASKKNARCVLLIINSRSGTMASAERIMNRIIGSEIPVIAYVYPENSTISRAGLLIACSCHLIVLSDNVSFGDERIFHLLYGISGKESRAKSIVLASSLGQKGRKKFNIAYKTLIEGEKYGGKKLKKSEFTSFWANTPEEAIKKVNGARVYLNQSPFILDTSGGKIAYKEMQVKDNIRGFFEIPDIIYLIFVMGVFGIGYELLFPGIVFPAAAGAIFSLYSLIFFRSYSINLIGLFLTVVSMALFLLSFKKKVNNIIKISYIIIFMTGSIIIHNTNFPFYYPNLLILIAMIAAFSYLAFKIKPKESNRDLVQEKQEFANEG